MPYNIQVYRIDSGNNYTLILNTTTQGGEWMDLIVDKPPYGGYWTYEVAIGSSVGSNETGTAKMGRRSMTVQVFNR